MTRIVYLLNARIPTLRAYGLQVVKTCEAFADTGTTVELVVPTRDCKTPGDPFAQYGARENFKITTLATPDFLHFGPLGFLVSALWFAEKARWRDSFWNADVIYSRDALVLLQYLLLGRPLVYEAHNKPTFASRIVAQHAKKVVVISNGLREAYEKAGVVPGKIIVAPDAVDEHLFDSVPERPVARAELGLPVEKKIVLYAGHLYPRKGADILAAAAAHLPDVLFVFVGGAADDLGRFNEKWGSNENIKIVGHIPHDKIPFYLRAADILVLPNSAHDEDSARYTSPMKLFEYMASGTPIVASDVPAIREVLDDSSTLFITPDDVAALVRGIEETLVRAEQSQARAQAAGAKVADYTWKKRAQAILVFAQQNEYNTREIL